VDRAAVSLAAPPWPHPAPSNKERVATAAGLFFFTFFLLFGFKNIVSLRATLTLGREEKHRIISSPLSLQRKKEMERENI
jgi:hypothetical protein